LIFRDNRNHFWRNLEMKHLLRILFVLALFCGVTSQAHAVHIGFADPNACGPDLSACDIVDGNGPITGFQFAMSACNPMFTEIPAGSYCIDLFNQSTVTITSITLTIPDSALGGLSPMCDTTTSFTGSCTIVPGGTDTFLFVGNPNDPFAPGDVEDLYLSGITASDVPTFNNELTAVVASTPEPDSLLLFGTGAMMAGLYLAKRPLLSAFGKK
jgi:hypothetical protein